MDDLHQIVADPRYVGIDHVMRALAGQSDGAKLQFLTSRRASLGSMAVLDALAAGRLEQVLAAAEAFAQG